MRQDLYPACETRALRPPVITVETSYSWHFGQFAHIGESSTCAKYAQVELPILVAMIKWNHVDSHDYHKNEVREFSSVVF